MPPQKHSCCPDSLHLRQFCSEVQVAENNRFCEEGIFHILLYKARRSRQVFGSTYSVPHVLSSCGNCAETLKSLPFGVPVV
ncbi:hypothetical protein T03_15074 [Trichinella britovi]|uniref:Uncharacterized protein n=1 Tax=Trichinella britovi TaxID=45882 RepID=A0A0V1C6L6_TRIBR|nr:hypothetical protein T03_15074 [Trichinella britovi]